MDVDRVRGVIDWLLRLEDRQLKAEVVDLGDGRGRTRLGITSRDSVPEWYWTCPAKPAVAYAEAWYSGQWVKRWRMDAIADTRLFAAVLACAVNCGPGAAIRRLELALGTTTLGRFSDVIELANDAADQDALLAAFQRELEAYYRAIVDRVPSDARFLDGWLARARAVYPALPA